MGLAMDYQCNIINCEYNEQGECFYCGDYWSLNDKNCISFEEKIDKKERKELNWKKKC